MALAVGAACGLIAAGAGRGQTTAPAPAAEAPAAAAPAPAATKPKAKPTSSASTVTVTVINSRAAGLTELQAAVSGSPAWKKVLGALKPGKQAVARLPDCQVDLHGSFDDGQTMEATGVDVCADKTLNLKD
jgi:hypothetical protein